MSVVLAEWISNYHHYYIKDSKAEICRGAVDRGWGGNVCCGFVVNHSVGGQ